MLLGGDAGHGLEPVGIVGRALLRCPFLHGIGNMVGHIQRQRGAARDAAAPCQKYFRIQPLPHDSFVENIAAKNCREIGDLVHRQNPFKKQNPNRKQSAAQAISFGSGEKYGIFDNSHKNFMRSVYKIQGVNFTKIVYKTLPVLCNETKDSQK